MPSGPKKRRAARRKRNPTEEEELEDVVEVCENVSLDGVNKAEAVDQISRESPPTVDQSEHAEKSKDAVTVGNEETESLHDATVMESEITNEKEYTESASVDDHHHDHEHDEILLQPDSKETEYTEVGESAFHVPTEMVNDVTSVVVKEVEDNMSKQDPFHEHQPQVIMVDKVDDQVMNVEDAPKEPLGSSSLVEVGESGSAAMVKDVVSVMNEGEEMSMEAVSDRNSSHEPQEMVNTVDQSMLKVIPVNEVQDTSVPVKSVSEMNVETDGQVKVEDHGPPSEMVNHDVSSVVKELGEGIMSIEVVLHPDPSIETSSHEPQETVKTVVQSVVLNKEEGEDPPVVIEVDDVETIISFEDAPDSFETPLGSPSLGYMSPVNEAQDTYLINEVDVQKSLQDSFKEPQGSFTLVDHVSTVDGLVQGSEVAEVSESACHCSPKIVDHVESLMKVNDEMSMESVVLEELLEPSSHELVDQLELKAITLEEDVGESVIEAENVEETYSKDVKDSFQEPVVGRFGLLSQGNGCAVGECACDCPLVNHVVSVTKNYSHEPQEMVDRSPVEGFVQFNGNGHIIERSLHEQEGDGTCMEGIVAGDEVGESACHEEMSIEEDPSGDSLYEQEVIVQKTLDQSVLKENQISEETFSKDAQEYSFKVAMGSSFWVNVPPLNPFVLGMEEDDDDISIQGVCEEEEPSLHELQEMVKAFDQKEVPLADPVTEVNIQTSLKDTQDSFKESLGSPSLHKVTFISSNVYLDGYGDEAIEPSLCGGKVMVVLKKIPFEEAQEPIIEVNVETSSKFGASACHGPPSVIDHGVSVLEDEEMSMECVLKEPFEELTQHSSDEQREMMKTVDLSVLNPHDVPAESGSKALGIVHGKECIEGGKSGESEAMVNLIGSVIKENEQISIEGVLEEHFEDVIGRSSHEPEVMIKTVDQFVMKGVPLKEAQDTFLPVITTEVNVETPFKDSQESLKEPLEIPSLDDMAVSPLEGVVQGNKLAEVDESAYHIVSVMKGGEEMSIEGVLQDPLKDPIGSSSHELETMVKTNDGEISMEGVFQDPIKEPSGFSSHEPQEMVKAVDQFVLKGLHLKEAQYPFIPVDSVIKVNIDTSFEDTQDSFETPLGSPFVGHVSPLEGFSESNEKIGDSSHEPHAMVKKIDQVVSKVITSEETQEPSLPVESVTESKVETALKDAKDQSSMDSLGSFSMAYVSSMEGVVLGNECNEVGERSFHGEVVSIDGVFEEPFKESIEHFSDELQTTVKTFEPFKDQSDFKADVKTSLKDNQDSLKEPLVSPFTVYMSPVEGVVEENECSENATMVNHVESLKKKNEDLSLEDVEESFKEPLHEQQTTVNVIDMSLSKEISLRESTDSSVPVESFIEVNVETSFRKNPDFVPLGTSSQVDVFPVKGIVDMANHGSSTVVNGSVVEGVGQRNEMVGLVRTLLEEIRRIRAFYEEGLRQTTQIDMHMLQVLEKFDSGQRY